MQILASIWDVWTTKESLIKTARRVGITSSSISINDMQKDKFAREEAVTQFTPTKSSENMKVESPLNILHGSKEYWCHNCENYKAKCNELVKTPGLEKLAFLVHKSLCSSKQVQENIVHLVILCTL